MISISKTNILGVLVSAINFNQAIEVLSSFIYQDVKTYVCCTNTHLICEAQSNQQLKFILNNAGLVTPDGIPLVWMNHLLGHGEVERVYGPDLLLAICEKSVQKGWKNYFYGGAPGVGECLAKNLALRFPGLHVVGISAPPFRPLSAQEDYDEIYRINSANPDILWVGLGAPKQEIWMASHLGKINALMIGVGAAFDFHAGVKPQAPLWMQRSGLEWLFRLLSEPRRLWKRYLVNNTLFLWLAALQLLGLKKFDLE